MTGRRAARRSPAVRRRVRALAQHVAHSGVEQPLKTPPLAPGTHKVAGFATLFPDLSEAVALENDAATATALDLPNRGPLRTIGGKPDPAILASFNEYGFYVLEGAISGQELAELQADVSRIVEHADALQHTARPAGAPPWFDGMSVGRMPPLGQDSRSTGRNPAAMETFSVPDDAPNSVLRSVHSWGKLSAAGLRLLGHPGLLAIAEAIHGPDFTPFNGANEEMIVKVAHYAPSVAWHQDGTTHINPDASRGDHGFNFFCQVFGCNADNAVWTLPGSHRWGHLDLVSLVGQWGERLPGALPCICQPGDIVMQSRNALHGSTSDAYFHIRTFPTFDDRFANRSAQRRITLNFGFFRRSHVLHARPEYDEARAEALCKLIPLAVAFRQETRGADFGERPYEYNTDARAEDQPTRWEGWNATTTQAALNAAGLGH